MKKSKKLLMEMGGVALPVVRKTLTTESNGISFDKLEPGMILTFPKHPGQKFVIITVAKFGEYIYYVPLKGSIEMARKSELAGVKVAEHGGQSKSIEVTG